MKLEEAITIITKISEGGDPYTVSGDSANLPINNPKNVEAICLTLSSLMLTATGK